MQTPVRGLSPMGASEKGMQTSSRVVAGSPVVLTSDLLTSVFLPSVSFSVLSCPSSLNVSLGSQPCTSVPMRPKDFFSVSVSFCHSYLCLRLPGWLSGKCIFRKKKKKKEKTMHFTFQARVIWELFNINIWY